MKVGYKIIDLKIIKISWRGYDNAKHALVELCVYIKLLLKMFIQNVDILTKESSINYPEVFPLCGIMHKCI